MIAAADAFLEMQFAGFERLATAAVGQYSWIVQGEKVR